MQALAILGKYSRQHLQRDLSVQTRIVCQINFTHAAPTDERNDLIWPGELSRLQVRFLVDDYLCRRFVRGSVQERAVPTIRRDERLDFLSESFVTATSFRDKRSA